MNTIPVESRIFALISEKKGASESTVNSKSLLPDTKSTMDMASLLELIKKTANETSETDNKQLLKNQIEENRYVVPLNYLTEHVFQTLSFERSY